MNIKRVIAISFALTGSVLGGCATAPTSVVKKTTPQVTWVFPVIKGFGAVHPRPDAAVQLDPAANYKIFVDVVSVPKDMGRPFPSLQRLARLVNLMGYGKVPPGHVHIAAVLDEKAAAAVFDNATYRKFFRTDNPNLAVLHALHAAGVTLLVCSQALAQWDIPDSDVDSSVTVSLSALTDPVVYEHEGYTYMRL